MPCPVLTQFQSVAIPTLYDWYEVIEIVQLYVELIPICTLHVAVDVVVMTIPDDDPDTNVALTVGHQLYS